MNLPLTTLIAGSLLLGPSTPLLAQQWAAGEGKSIVFVGGNVGIGTNSPKAPLDVNNGIITRGKNSGVIFLPRDGTGDGYQVYSPDAGSGLRFFFGVDRIVFDGTGNVGIGTMKPQSKLAVNGVITAKDVKTTPSGWADYVFQPGYQLTPLSEVATFVEQNRHLPGIPSEAEAVKDGVSVSEMQTKLLAKIEELTLHMIQAEKQNQDLRDRIAKLEKK